jgi:hypothetical protein
MHLLASGRELVGLCHALVCWTGLQVMSALLQNRVSCLEKHEQALLLQNIKGVLAGFCWKVVKHVSIVPTYIFGIVPFMEMATPFQSFRNTRNEGLFGTVFVVGR